MKSFWKALKAMLAASVVTVFQAVWEGGKWVMKAVSYPINALFSGGGGGEPELDETQETARQQAAAKAQERSESALEEASMLKLVTRTMSRDRTPDPEHLEQPSEPVRRFLDLAPAAEVRRLSMMKLASLQALIDSGRLARRADEISGKSQEAAPGPQASTVVSLAGRIAARRAAEEGPASPASEAMRLAASLAPRPSRRAG